ncbi:MRN complex-interacting protein-like isoform X2 [Ochotona curzoniae]|uniref:MRN complex-interacting protein-like isoform X2 n=1 Tax=Ochotona curzoniae TaxID=130825 RepID=UPI001B353A40|nr:MRN complex-interacting protein-like isoform X2 [Ochotona curzoniae]
MAPPQRCRVLRCCSCGLFQAHQLKKSPKWTCKACGKKQSFLRSYGEGSGADCRRHVQKLNLLQGQVSELPLRSLEGSGSVREEELEDHHQAENVDPQEMEPESAQLLHKRDIPDLGTPRGTWPPQKDSPGLNVKVKEGGSHCLWNHEDPRPQGLRVAHGELPSPACQAEATSSKWMSGQCGQ